MIGALQEGWPLLLTLLGLSLDIAATAHIILTKRNVRAAIGWVGLVWLSPFIGVVLYGLFGINRIRRRARELRPSVNASVDERMDLMSRATEVATSLGYDSGVVRLMGAIAGEELTTHNRFDALVNGDQAYPSMLAAIDQAEHSVGLCSYIFDHDRVGVRFIDALVRAQDRGVDVRVLIDGVGARYSKPRTPGVLRQRGVPVGEFLNSTAPWRMPYFNLRNHRKVLVVDGRVAFTGGMNIREGCVLGEPSDHPVQDLHFRVEGPVVSQIAEVFAQDWAFVTDEHLDGDRWFPAPNRVGDATARVIPDGPDDDFEKIYDTLLSALNHARESIRIATPYFLPDENLVRAMHLAAKAGRRIEILIPEVNNLRFVQWAMWGQLQDMLVPGITVWLTPPPFDHTKILLLDGRWVLLGSANWDARSLQLNFEMNVSTMNPELAEELGRLLDRKISSARRLTAADVEARSLPVKLRDGALRLFSPYL